MTDNITDLTDQEVAHYRINRRIGGGVLAGVYEATDQILEKSVALKVLLISADDLTRQRFRQEARTGSSLVHPHIVKTLQVGQTASDGIAYIAMELVKGLTLAELLVRSPVLSVADTSNVLEPVSRALQYAHEQGIVHRDVKPSNILLRYVAADTPNSVQLSALDSAVVPLLSDFGISRALDSPNLTNAGRAIGTPSYMAPEQCAGSREVDGRADIYSLGTVLYRCLVGRAPYVGSTTQILHAHVYEPLTIPDDVLDTLPASIVDVLKRSLAKGPENRYQDVGVMARDIAQTTQATILPAPIAGEAHARTAVRPTEPTPTQEEDTATDDALERPITNPDETVELSGTTALSTEVLSPESVTPTKLPRAVLPLKRTSTTHPRVTRPLPPRPAAAARRERNWAGFVIGGALMLVILFAGIAALRSIWPANPDFSATTTTATIDTGGNDAGGNDNNEDASPAASAGETDSSVVEDDSSKEPTVVEVEADASAEAAGDSTSRVEAEPDVDNGEADNGEVDNREADVSSETTDTVSDTGSDADKDGSQAGRSRDGAADELLEPPIEATGHWEDVQFFHARRNWQDAADSLTLMRKVDSRFEPDEFDPVRFNIYMGLGALQIREMLSTDADSSDADNTDTDNTGKSAIDRKQLALAANFYIDALRVEPESGPATALLNALDTIAETTSTELEQPVPEAEVATLREAYADYSASLALQGNYCNAVEQLSAAVLLDNVILLNDDEKQIEQLTSYIEICDDPTDILEILADKRRARQSVSAADTIAVTDADAPDVETDVDARDVETVAEATAATQDRDGSQAEQIAPTATQQAPAARPTPQPELAASSPSSSALTGSILYSSIDGGVSKIWRVSVAPNAESTEISQSARQPTADPTGQLVTFHSDQGYKEGIRGVDLLGTLSLPEGNAIQFIYHPEAAQFSPPTWSPTGDKMLFGSTVDADRVSRIYSASNNSSGDYFYVAYGREPDWHPFDDLIVYKGADDTGNRPGLWLMGSSGNNRERFSDNSGDSRPVWSANGLHIIFMSNGRSGNWDIFRANYETRTVQQLTTDPANDGLPTVSPDGKHVAFLSNRSGIWQIWVVPIAGGTPQPLASIRGALPNWLEHAIHWVR